MIDELCEVELCSKTVLFGGLCQMHRKKAVAGSLDYDDDGRIWDTCSKGHRWTEENTHWESNSKGGKRRRCRQCLALKAQRKSEEPPVVMAPNPIRLKDERMTAALDQFDKAQVEIKGKCYGKYEQWSDYDESSIPNRSTARAMCSGCPLFAACGNTAEAIKPGWSIWAGEVWVYGQRFDESMREGLINDNDG